MIKNIVINESGKELTASELAYAANEITISKPFSEGDFIGEKSRTNGALCNCPNGGKFVLLPSNNPSVTSGCKRYMKCVNCGQFSHL